MNKLLEEGGPGEVDPDTLKEAKKRLEGKKINNFDIFDDGPPKKIIWFRWGTYDTFLFNLKE